MSKKLPHIINGDIFNDRRGKVFSCNDFDMSNVKRIYSIENFDSNFIRGWKGHKIETRWFFATKGSIIIQTVAISDLENKKIPYNISTFKLTENNLDILKVPPGHATSIKQFSNGDRICVFADYRLNDSGDEDLRWELNYNI
tara:strand:- start:1767 stop:2192 length:426 start_codon:yes stop_codon:yes gene_type:complete